MMNLSLAEQLMHTTRYIDGKTTSETRYFISSLAPNAKVFANAVRKHWAIENQLHWVLDVSFRELYGVRNIVVTVSTV